jgi:hypothetical protein
MALSILDGNQSATTLSTILSSGQHITAHTVVSLGTQAITDIVNATSAGLTNTQLRASAVTVGGTVTVGNSLTISSLPAISGTVTANVGGIASGVTVPVRLYAEQISGSESGQDTLVVCDSVGQLLVNATVAGSSVLGYDGYAYVSVKPSVGSSVTIGNTVTIAGTVTANPTGTQTIAGTVTANLASVVTTDTYWATQAVKVTGGNGYGIDIAGIDYAGSPALFSEGGGIPVYPRSDFAEGASFPVSGTVSLGIQQSDDADANIKFLPIGFAQSDGGGMLDYWAGVKQTNPLPVYFPSNNPLPAGTNQIGSVTASISNSVTIGSLPAISGTVTANTFAVQGTAVTTSNFTSTTASTVLASFNATREVLTIFNEGAGNLHICAGATCTTIAYQVRLSAGDYYEVPNHQTSLTHSAVFATAGTARVTQVS